MIRFVISNKKVYTLLGTMLILIVSLSLFAGIDIRKSVQDNTDEFYAFEGILSYIKDENWKDVIRPLEFDDSLMTLDIYSGDTLIDNVELQSISIDEKYHLSFVHDGYGGGGFVVSNIPKEIDGKEITAAKLRVNDMPFYQDSTSEMVQFSEAATTILSADVLLEPYMIPLTIIEDVEGDETGETPTFTVKVKMSNPNNGSEYLSTYATRTVYVTKGSTGATIEVPSGLRCLVTQADRDDYAVKNYGVSYLVENGSSNQEIDIEKDVTILNTFYADEIRDGKNVTKYKVKILNIARNSKAEWNLVWLDNNNYNRPVGTFKLQFSCEGTEYVDVTEDDLEKLGMESMPTYKVIEHMSFGDEIKYAYSNLPAVDIEGNPIRYKVVQTTESNDYFFEYDAATSTFYNTIKTRFTATMRWLDSDANPDAIRPLEGQIKKILKLYSCENGVYKEINISKNIKITKSEKNDSTWTIEITKDLPQYSKNNNRITYMLIEGTIESTGEAKPIKTLKKSDYVGEEIYNVSYYNEGSTEVKSDRCYNEQLILHILKSDYNFVTTKKWNDDESAIRPETTVTLWRYTVTDPLDREVKIEQSARTITQDADGNDLVLQYKLKTSGAKVSDLTMKDKYTETLSFSKANIPNLADDFALPKYDPAGNEYIYFVVETVENIDPNNYYDTVYKNRNGKVLNYGATLGGEIISTRGGQVSLEVTKLWNAASAAKNIEGAKVTFKVLGKEQGTNTYKELTIMGGQDYIDEFGVSKLRDKTEILVNPYDSQGHKYEDIVVQEKSIVLKGKNVSIKYSTEDKDEWTFSMGSDTYEGKCGKLVPKGHSVIYTGVEMNAVNITNTVTTPKDYSIIINWDSDITEEERTGQILEIVGVSIKNVEEGEEPPKVTYKLAVNNDAQEENGVTRGTAVITDGNGKSTTIGYTETIDDAGNTIWTVDELPGLRMYDSEGYLIDYRVQSVVNDVPEGTVVSWFSAFSTNAEGTLIRNTKKDDDEIYVHGTKIWNDGGDIGSRYKIKLVISDPDHKEIEPQILYLESKTFWHNFVKFSEGYFPEGVAKYTLDVKEILVGPDGKEYEPYEGDDGKTYITTDKFTYRVEMEQYNAATDDPSAPSTGNILGVSVYNTRVDHVDFVIENIWKDGQDQSNTRAEKVTYEIYQYDVYSNLVDKIVVTLDENKNAVNDDIWVKTITKLDKYDEYGRKYDYYINEVPGYTPPNNGEYKLNLEYNFTPGKSVPDKNEIEDYRFGDDKKNDEIRYICTSLLKATTSFVVYQKWLDEAIDPESRPDMYLTAYKKNTSGEAGPEAPIEESIKNQIWTAGTDDTYSWKIEFINLDKYDENGYLNDFYVVQSVNDIEAAGLKYLIEYRDKEYNLLETNYTEPKGYIVNTLYDLVVVEGEKIWKNVAGFSAGDMPPITIDLFRVDPQGNEEMMNSIYLGNGATLFSFDKQVVDENGTIVEYDLQKYTNKGEAYTYYVKERREEIIAPGECEEGDEGDIYNLFKVKRENNTIINEFNRTTNNRKITITKKWNRDQVVKEEKDVYPSVTLKLYRYTRNDVYDVSNMEYVGSKTVSSNEFKNAENGEYDITFDGLLIYSPKGQRYKYFVQESDMGEAYESEYSIDGTVEGITVKEDGIDFRDVKLLTLSDEDKVSKGIVTNTFDAHGGKKVQGYKMWNDYFNFYNLRPTSINIELSRGATSSDGYNRVPEINIPIEVKDAEDESVKDKPYVVWNKNVASGGYDTWLFTIYNLPKYAANGQPYQYSVRENDENASKYYSDSGRITKNMSNINNNGVLILGNITNKFTESHTVKKHWIDGNNIYNFRPREVTMELEYSFDNGVTWIKALNQNGSDQVISTVLTRRDVVANTRGNTWRSSVSNMPSHIMNFTVNEEKTQLVSDLWAHEAAIPEQQALVNTTRTAYEDKESAVSGFDAIYQQALVDLTEANKKVDEIQTEFNDAEAALVSAQKAKNDAQEALDNAQEALTRANDEYTAADGNSKAAQEAVVVAQEALDRAEAGVQTATEAVDKAQTELNSLRERLEDLQAELLEAQTALNTARIALDNATREWEEATDADKAEKAALRDEKEALYNAAVVGLSAAQNAVDEQSSKINTAETNLTTATQVLEEANQAVRDANMTLNNASKDNDDAQAAMLEATAKVQEANIALADANTVLQSAETTLGSAEAAFNIADEKINNAKAIAANAQIAYNTAEANLNNAIGERDIAKIAYEAAEAELTRLSEEKDKIDKSIQEQGITIPTDGNPEIWEDIPKPVIYRFVETKIGGVEVPSSRQVGSYVVSEPTVRTDKDLTEIKNSMQSTKLTITKVWDDVDNYYQTRFNKTYYKLQRIAQYEIPQESSSQTGQGNNNLVTRPQPKDEWEQVYDIDGKPIILELTEDDMCKDENGVYNWWQNIFYNLPVAREGDISAGEDPIVKLYYRAVECTNEDLNPQLVTVNEGSDGTYTIDATKTYKHYRDVTDYNLSWTYDQTAKTNASVIENHMITKEDANEENGTNLVSEIAAEKRWAKDTNLLGYDVVIGLKRRKSSSSSYSNFPKAITKTIYYNGEGVSWNNLPAYNEDGEAMYYKADELTTSSDFKVHIEIITSDIETGQRDLYQFTNIQLMRYVVRSYWEKNDRLLPTSEQNFSSKSLFQQRITDTGEWKTMQYKNNGNDWVITLNTTYRTTRIQTITFSQLEKYTVDNKRIYYRAIETHINDVPAEDNKAYITSNVDAELDGDVYTDNGSTDLYHTLRTESLNIKKYWDDDDDYDNMRPRINDKSKMNMTLYADYGSGYKEVPTSFYTLNWSQHNDNTWAAKISNLPKYNKKGNVLLKYKLEETTIPDRYFISRDFEVPEFKDEINEYDYEISNTLTLLLKLKKYDEVNGTFLRGTQFEVYKFNDDTGWYTEKIGSTLTVGYDGYINFQMSQPGEFVLVETKAVKGYELYLDENGEPDLTNGNNFQCYFSVRDNNLRQTLYITNELTQEIDKPSPEDYVEPSAVSNEVGDADFTAATVPPKENVYFSIIKGWYNQVTSRGLANKRKLGELTFSKRDENTAKKLNGIVFALYRYENEDGTGNPVYVGDIETGKNYVCSKTMPLTISEDGTEPTDDGKVHISKLPWGKYWMDEKSTLIGYSFPNGEHTFVVNASTVNDSTSINENIVVKYDGTNCIDNVVRNEKTKFRFYKRGYSNCYLTGGTFKIVSNDESRTEQRFWRNIYSDDESKKETVLKPNDWVYGLPVGSYRIVEVDVPYGYKPAPDVVFGINEYGWIVNASGKNTGTRYVNMYDDAVMVDIINVDEDFITPINGSTFELTGKFANSTGSAITGVETRRYTISSLKWALRGNVLPSFPNEEKYVYKLEQTAVPVGYELQPQVVYFIINENYQVELTDKDGNIPDAELAELYKQFVKTDNDRSVPSIIFENLRIPVNDIYILNGETYLDPNSQNICKLFYAYDHVENDARLGEPIQFWVDKTNLGKLEFAVTTSADGTDKSKYVDSGYIIIKDSKGQIMKAEDNMYRLDEDEVYTLEFTSAYLNGIKKGSRMLYLYSHMPRIDDIEGMYIVRRTSFAQH